MKIYKTLICTLLFKIAIGSFTGIANGQEAVSVAQLLRNSQSALADDKIGQALQHAEKAIELDPAHPPAWCQLGVTLYRSGKAEESVKAFRRTIEMNAKDETAWRGLALALRQCGQHEQAVDALRNYLNLKPEETSAWRDLATWLVEEQKYVAAEEAYRKIVQLKPKNRTVWRELGALQSSMRNFDSAVVSLQRAVAIDASDTASWRGLADALTRLGREEDAIEALRRIVADQPADAAAWRTLGLLYQKGGNGAQAIVAYRNVLKQRPDDHAVRRDLGWLLWEDSQRATAVKHLKQAVHDGVDEREKVIFQVIARLGEENQSEQAVKFMRKTDPQSSPAELAIALVRHKRVKAALPILDYIWQNGNRTPSVGVNLAYVRARNGKFGELRQYLSPLLSAPDKCSTENAELALQTLRMNASETDTPDLLAQLEVKLNSVEPYTRQIAEILEVAATKLRLGEDYTRALRIYRELLARDPDHSCWIWAVLLAEKVEEKTPLKWINSFEKRASDPSVIKGIQGIRADRNGDHAAATDLMQKSIVLNPDQPALRKLLFISLLNQNRVADAKLQTQWFAKRVTAGETTLRSYLAELLTAQGDHRLALQEWRVLQRENPESTYYTISTASTLVKLDKPDQAIEVLLKATESIQNYRLFEALAETASACGNYRRAAEWADQGLKLKESRTLLRVFAESREQIGLDAQSTLTAARKFLIQDPGHVPMTLLAGRMLENMAATNELIQFHSELLARNPYFVPSLKALRIAATQSAAVEQAVELAHRRTLIQLHNAEVWRHYANSLAEQQKYRQALKILRKENDTLQQGVTPILVYNSPDGTPYAGRNSVKQINQHIQYLAEQGYTFVNRFTQIDASGEDQLRVMMVLIDPSTRVIEAIDPVLREHHAAVLYAGNTIMPELTLEGKPLSAAARAILSSKRWQPACGGIPGGRRQRVDHKESILGNPLTHPLHTGMDSETESEYRNRIDAELKRASQMLQNRDERVLIYPGGDYGQLSLDMNTNSFNLLHSSVAHSFTHAVYFDSCGFLIKSEHYNPLRIPARSVPPQWSTDQLAKYLTNHHPLALNWLERARALYWNGQHEDAHAAFQQAEKHGADPTEVNFNWGMNAYMQGDLPTARAKLLSAQQLDPENTMIPAALERVREQRRSQITLYLTGWQDNEDRDYFKYGGNADMFVSERIRLGILADRNRWSTDDIGSEYGTRYGLRTLAYLAPQTWFTGSLWLLDMDDVDDLIGGSVALRLPNPLLSGYIIPSFTRDEIETVEALRRDIHADTYRLSTYSRLIDIFDLYADIMQIMRNDDNDTTLLDGRLLYRVNEWPYLGVGWRFRVADSDRDPPEYWAPEELQQHMLHATLRGEWQRLRGFVSAEAGYAKERDTSWDFAWSARGRGTLTLTRNIELLSELRWAQSPSYERLQGMIGVTRKF
jgi:tetratricopeptide (TPR) repeat protein